MSRGRAALVTLTVVVLATLGYWISTKTYWGDIEVPMPPRGEARTNPTYAAQRFVEALDARATRDRTLALPPPSSVIVLSSWNWDLSSARRAALERWVESGGRLVLDGSVRWNDEFETWSGIGYQYRESDGDANADKSREPPCRQYQERGTSESTAVGQVHWLCDFDDDFFVTTRRRAEWTLSEARAGVQVARVRVDRGEVTYVNGNPFREREIFNGDHGWLLVKAANLRKADDVHFLSEADYPSLLTLAWQRGTPVIVFALVLLIVLLWRGAIRLGPLAAPPVPARRSLAEQIRGTGSFVLRHAGADSLHAASVRALDEAARGRVAGYAHLSASLRAEALARLTNLDPGSLAAAIYHPRMRRRDELGNTIALLETARRRLRNATRTSNGTN